MNIAEIIAAERKSHPAVKEQTILHAMEPDLCCSKPFSKAGRAGSLDAAESWTCPKCGVEYRPTLIDGAIRHWTAYVYVELIGKR